MSENTKNFKLYFKRKIYYKKNLRSIFKINIVYQNDSFQQYWTEQKSC